LLTAQLHCYTIIPPSQLLPIHYLIPPPYFTAQLSQHRSTFKRLPILQSHSNRFLLSFFPPHARRWYFCHATMVAP